MLCENEGAIQAEAEGATCRLIELDDRATAVHGVFAGATSISLSHLAAQVALARAVVDSWLQASLLAPNQWP